MHIMGTNFLNRFILISMLTLLAFSPVYCKRRVKKTTVRKCADFHARGLLKCDSKDTQQNFCCTILRLKIFPSSRRIDSEFWSERLPDHDEEDDEGVATPDVDIQKIREKGGQVQTPSPTSYFAVANSELETTTVRNTTPTFRVVFNGGHRRGSIKATNASASSSNVVTDEMFNAVKQPEPPEEDFSREGCATLKVPCRFVSDHQCCRFEMPMDLVARARSMDGSADLRWRSNHPEGRSLSTPAMAEGNSSPSLFNYTYAVTKANVTTPVYQFNGDPAALVTILGVCWRLHYVQCSGDGGSSRHPCCQMVSEPGPLTPADNRLTRWLRKKLVDTAS